MRKVSYWRPAHSSKRHGEAGRAELITAVLPCHRGLVVENGSSEGACDVCKGVFRCVCVRACTV